MGRWRESWWANRKNGSMALKNLDGFRRVGTGPTMGACPISSSPLKRPGLGITGRKGLPRKAAKGESLPAELAEAPKSIPRYNRR